MLKFPISKRLYPQILFCRFIESNIQQHNLHPHLKTNSFQKKILDKSFHRCTISTRKQCEDECQGWKYLFQCLFDGRGQYNRETWLNLPIWYKISTVTIFSDSPTVNSFQFADWLSTIHKRTMILNLVS